MHFENLEKTNAERECMDIPTWMMFAMFVGVASGTALAVGFVIGWVLS